MKGTSQMRKRKFKFSNVAALMALVLAISGGAYAAKEKIGTKQIAKNAVTGGKIKPGSVKNRHLGSGPKAALKPIYFSTTRVASLISIGAGGGPLIFDGAQLGKNFTPISDSEFRADEPCTCVVAFAGTLADVQVGGGVYFAVNGQPTHLVTGPLTAGVPLILHGTLILSKGDVLSIETETSLQVQVASGTQLMLDVFKVGGPKAPIRNAHNPEAEEG